MSIPPSTVLAAWPKPNYVNPEKQGPAVIITSAVFMFMGCVAVAIRLYGRLVVRRYFGVDDALIVVALCFTIAVTIIVCLGNAEWQWDRHLYDISPSVYTDSSKALLAVRIIWVMAFSFVRLSVLCLYYRLLYHCHGQRYRWALHLTAAGTIGFLISNVVASCFLCIPIQQYWTFPRAPATRCFNDLEFMIATAGINTTFELVIAILPIIAVFKLGVARPQRCVLLAILSLGFVVVIAGCVRLWYLVRAVQTYDLSWYANPQWLWSMVETNTALISACGPPMLPVLRRLTGRCPPEIQDSLNPATSGRERDLNRIQARLLDPEEQPSWNFLTRIIDIEGIADDGFGYTVSISAPHRTTSRYERSSNLLTKLNTKIRHRPSIPTISDLHLQEQEKDDRSQRRKSSIRTDIRSTTSSETSRTEHMRQLVEITTTTSVQLTESFRTLDANWDASRSWRDYTSRRHRHAPHAGCPSSMLPVSPADEAEIEQASIGLGMDWSLLDATSKSDGSILSPSSPSTSSFSHEPRSATLLAPEPIYSPSLNQSQYSPSLNRLSTQALGSHENINAAYTNTECHDKHYDHNPVSLCLPPNRRPSTNNRRISTSPVDVRPPERTLDRSAWLGVLARSMGAENTLASDGLRDRITLTSEEKEPRRENEEREEEKG